MELSDFQIGLGFRCGGRLWRCTDIGSRVVVAICVDASEIATKTDNVTVTRTLDRQELEADGWFNGPPYALAETIFDEYDQEACSLTAEPADA